MSRLQAYVFLAGVLLIALGLFVFDGASGAADAAPRGRSGAGAIRRSGAIPPLGRGGPAPSRGDRDAIGADERRAGGPTSASTEPPTVEVVAYHAGDGTPAASASIGLWRRASGEGVTYRTARRIADDRTADLEGRARFEARPDWPLEVVARAAGNGPMLRVPVEALAPGSHREIVVRVERPPAPLRVIVRSGDGVPLAGASVRTLTEHLPARGAFPGRSRLVRRTDGNGFADLEGADREVPWVLVEAAGFGPVALSAASLSATARSVDGPGGRDEVDLTLQSAAGFDVSVTGLDGAQVRDVEVRVEFDLDGLPLEAVSTTGRRGSARIDGLPAQVGIQLAVRERTRSDPSFQDVFVLEPGERREIGVQLDR
ncbi:MAG: hypothetical protein AAGB93_01905 [Planctomycetota bacterium]